MNLSQKERVSAGRPRSMPDQQKILEQFRAALPETTDLTDGQVGILSCFLLVALDDGEDEDIDQELAGPYRSHRAQPHSSFAMLAPTLRFTTLPLSSDAAAIKVRRRLSAPKSLGMLLLQLMTLTELSSWLFTQLHAQVI